MKLVFATNNPNKLSEIRSLVPKGITILCLDDINCHEEIPETNPSLKGNALQKARYIYENYGFNCFSDDTGLEIDEINGEPGVYSARYAGAECKDEDNMKLVLNKMSGKLNRTANFRTIIALVIDNEDFFFEGICEGFITNNKIGIKGFGYDPIFKPLGFEKTFAEMGRIQKGKISHRGKAVNKLIQFLKC